MDLNLVSFFSAICGKGGGGGEENVPLWYIMGGFEPLDRISKVRHRKMSVCGALEN